MNENLKVNSKTNILEFKRKHNLLVDGSALILNISGSIKELSSEQIENLKCGDIVVKSDSSGKHPYIVTFRNSTGICLTYVDASVVETQSYDKVGNSWQYNSEDKTELGNGGFAGEINLTFESPNYVIKNADKPSESGVYILVYNNEKIGCCSYRLMGESGNVVGITGLFGGLLFTGQLAPVPTDIVLSNYLVKIIPSFTASDIGKVLTVNTNGNLIWAEPSGGTKLYKHRLVISSGTSSFYITIISTSSDQITLQSVYGGSVLALDIHGNMINFYGTAEFYESSSVYHKVYINFYSEVSGGYKEFSGIMYGMPDKTIEDLNAHVLKNSYFTATSVTDTVTEL